MSSCRATNANAWKAAARAWWERLNEARAVNHELSLARDKAENERDIANTKITNMRAAFEMTWCPDGESSIGFEALLLRAIDADRKHPRDIADGMPLEEDASVYLERARALLNRRSTWLRALMCEVAEARYELVIGNTDRLADELLDVAAVALRWRRAILERTKTGE